METAAGRDRPVLTALDRLEEPASLLALRELLAALLPRVDLPDLLLEVAGWTGFPAEFTHVSEGASRAEDLHLSVCAALIAEACNIGLEPLIHPGRAALTRARLSWVEQNYLRADTLTAANTRLVDAQADISLARAWRGGEVASADGLRFVVPVRTLNAGPNPRYFGPGRGVTYLNFLSDQFSGFHAVVVPGTLRDSLYILEGLLEQQTTLRPAELMTDTAGYTDIVFGLFRLLGYQFSPRLADLGDARFWRTEQAANYGSLNGVARNRVDTALITTHWDDLLRVAGSLSTGTVRASEILRVLQGGGRPTPTGHAVAELGRVAKTLYLLAYLDDEPYRRRILTQLNRTEARHALARQVFHGQCGQLRQRYREGQEDQLGALGLVLNAIVLWNTRYLDAALTQLRSGGHPAEDSDVQRLPRSFTTTSTCSAVTTSPTPIGMAATSSGHSATHAPPTTESPRDHQPLARIHRADWSVAGSPGHRHEPEQPERAVHRLPLPVESAWGAVPVLPPVRFPRPLAEPAVRISPQRALHGLCHQGWLSRCQGLGIVLPRYR